jgi:hypothetical protein
VNMLYFGQFNPLYYSPLPLPSYPLLFNSFQYSTDAMYFHIVDCPPLFLSLLPRVP